VDGVICNGCGSCCSRLCAPYGDTGVSVCQPASGCHPNGGLCKSDSDCCGATGTGLPGDGNVVCEIPEGATVGLCRNPTGCSPQGNVCHYNDYACSVSSSRNNCCAGTGNSGVCQLDRLGVPRCNALGDTCRNSGETCASSDDCCNDAPCTADAGGVLRCQAAGCVEAGGSCTISGDCCRGSQCVTELGSTRGTCSIVAPPPQGGTGGAGGSTQGGAGGSGGSAAAGSGGAAEAGSGGSSTEPSCAVYGQQCEQTGDCCSEVPCSGGYCIYPLQ
jgi:hypothetical protein